MEHEASEQWQPGKVEMDKLIMGFTYLAATSLAVPHFPSYSSIDKPPKPPCPRVEKELPWAGRKRKRSAAHKKMATFHSLLNQFRANPTHNTAILDLGTTLRLNKVSDGLARTGPLNVAVAVATGEMSCTTGSALLPITQLKATA